MANQTPDANSTYRAYIDGQTFIGTVQIDLPELQSMTAEVKGAGIAGAIDKTVTGMFQAMSLTINFRTVTSDAMQLLKSGQHHLEFWASVQHTDPGTHKFVDVQHKIIVLGEFKNLTPGKLAVAETQDRTLEMEIVYFKEEFDGKELIEVDKYNHVYRVEGEDQLAQVKANIWWQS